MADRTAGIGLGVVEQVSGRRMVVVAHMELDLGVVRTDWVAGSHSRRLGVVGDQAAGVGCSNRPGEVALRWQLALRCTCNVNVLFRQVFVIVMMRGEDDQIINAASNLRP